MNPIESILKEYPLIILDGALATELEKRGLDINDALWSAKVLAENPDVIRQVHYDYFASGADCAITASYQATIEGFQKRGYSEAEAVALIKKSVELALKAREDFWREPANRKNRPYPVVAGSVGPYGAYLADGSEYRGDYKLTEKELVDFHRPRIKALVEAGADILACETVPSFVEAKAIAKLLEEFKGIYAWISFSCKNDFEISDGTSIFQCAKWLEDFESIAAIGINCTAPKYVPSLIGEIAKGSSKSIVVYPNSGEEYNAESKDWHGECSSDAYGLSARQWYEAGAKLIGGCCRTSPKDIQAIAAWARK
jgi:homocysteine S-methyltransferase